MLQTSLAVPSKLTANIPSWLVQLDDSMQDPSRHQEARRCHTVPCLEHTIVTRASLVEPCHAPGAICKM